MTTGESKLYVVCEAAHREEAAASAHAGSAGAAAAGGERDRNAARHQCAFGCARSPN